jgi:hypothetical protein
MTVLLIVLLVGLAAFLHAALVLGARSDDATPGLREYQDRAQIDAMRPRRGP